MHWRDLKYPTTSGALTALTSDFPVWRYLHDRATALTTQQYRHLALQVVAAVRYEDGRYFEKLAHESGHTYTKEGLTGLWQRLRGVLRKHRDRAAHQNHEMGQSLLQHFERLEAGCTTTAAQVRQNCIDRNNQETQLQAPLHFLELQELPTRAEVEDLCLRQRPHRAPGPDGLSSDVCRLGAAAVSYALHNVFLKSFLNGTEPWRYKGGYLQAIWKRKGSLSDPEAYRGILLADCFGKTLHAWSRRRLLSTMQTRRAPGQLGGLPSQQTAVGIHTIRLHCRLGRLKGISTSTIFVDLRAAFHHMLRQFIFNTTNYMTYERLSHVLAADDFNIDRVLHDLSEACKCVPHGMPDGLRRFLHDLHCGTRFSIDRSSDDTTETFRGTRPGSPMADIGFNLLMSKVLHQLQDLLDAMPEYRQGQSAIGTRVPPIAWVDDLAIPLASVNPNALEALTAKVAAAVHTVFTDHGMTLNLSAGKTEAVLMFRGAGANKCRSRTFDREHSPSIVVTTETHILNLRIVASYKHLGARFAMDADLDQEIQARISSARRAFEEIKKPVFLNKHIPAKGRVQLYSSLILSRLFYGCATWSDITADNLHQLESMVIGHYRRIYNDGFWQQSQTSNQEFCHQHQLPSFRVSWARHRLMYLQHLAKHGHNFHKDLLMTELHFGKGWLHEVQDDLRWLQQFHALPFDLPSDRASWNDALDHIATLHDWKPIVKRACHKHLLQEAIAKDVQYYHTEIVRELHTAGIEVYQQDEPTAEVPQYACDDCRAAFHTKQQLAAHRHRLHGWVSDERALIQSTICAGCLRDFHTTWRVQQHLRYRQNGCWDRLYGAKLPDVPVTIRLPPHLKHVKRLPAIRRHYGPLRPTSTQRQRQSLRRRITDIQQAGREDFVWWNPEEQTDLLQQTFAALDHALSQWFADDDADLPDFHNLMFAILFSFDEPDMKMGRIFVHWIEKRFYDLWPDDLSAERHRCLEHAHLTMLDDMPTWTMRLEMKRLAQLWEHLPPDEPDFPVREHPRAQRQYNRCHQISSLFQQMKDEEALRGAWRLLSRPRKPVAADHGPFYIVHLYSGRRREQDVHDWMMRYVEDHGYQNVVVLSLDTAIHDSMNVHSPQLWTFLLEAARAGRVLAVVLGPPCETWSSARFETLLNDDGTVRRGPRPLRLAEELWGLAQLSARELAQLGVGNALLLRGIWLAVVVALSNGAVILEHPAVPYEEHKPSIWRTALVKLLLRRPFFLFSKITVQQWRFGSPGVKPTTFLYANLASLPRELEAGQLANVVKPQTALIGVSNNGCFATSAAKEYPAALNRTFAAAIGTRLEANPALRCVRSMPDPIGSEFARLAATAERSMWLPDYQPQPS